MSTVNSGKPLSGIRVVDFTTYVAAPSCSMTLGYLGADVIKVEPIGGDPNRIAALGVGVPATDTDNPMYDAVNGYKRAISLNLRSDEGKEIMLRLMSDADIFVTNYREKALEGIGITYDRVKEINPKLVYGLLNGYGFKGEDSARAGFDYIAFFARSGFADVTQYEGLPPMVPTFGSGDTISGMSLAIGILAAFIRSKGTGRGELVTTSLLANGLWVLNCAIIQNQFSKVKSSIEKPNFLSISNYYQCADGTWVRFCGISAERYWASFCRALGLEEYIDDPRFSTSVEQRKNDAICTELIRSRVKRKNYSEWEPVFRSYDLPYEKVQTLAEAGEDRQAKENGYICELEYAGLERTVNAVMPPIKMNSIEEKPKEKAPRIGQNSIEILQECGYSAENIEQFISGGTVRQI